MSTAVASTRDRLIDATLELVSQRGYDAASVGDIESHAGMAPRSGALYKYFDSKLEVLEAGLERHLASVTSTEQAMADAAERTEAQPADLVTEIEGLARWLLAELDRERMITHIIEREGGRFPGFRDRMRIEISDRGYRAVSQYLETHASLLRLPTTDLDALAVLLVGALINLRRSSWTLGATPLAIDDDRIVAVFMSTISTLTGLPASSNTPRGKATAGRKRRQ